MQFAQWCSHGLVGTWSQCWKQADKETFREEEGREEKPVPGRDESRQLHCAVGREQELGPGQRKRFKVGLEAKKDSR